MNQLAQDTEKGGNSSALFWLLTLFSKIAFPVWIWKDSSVLYFTSVKNKSRTTYF